jgi:hypothetical protein
MGEGLGGFGWACWLWRWFCEVVLRNADGAREKGYEWLVVAISRNVRRTTHSPACKAQ